MIWSGFLTGAYRSLDDFEKDDFRRMIPRFQGDAFALVCSIKFDGFKLPFDLIHTSQNLKLVDALK